MLVVKEVHWLGKLLELVEAANMNKKQRMMKDTSENCTRMRSLLDAGLTVVLLVVVVVTIGNEKGSLFHTIDVQRERKSYQVASRV